MTATESMPRTGRHADDHKRGGSRPVTVEGSLAQVRDVLPGILEASPTPVALFRPDRSIAYRNATWRETVGDDDPVVAPAVGGAADDPIALVLAGAPGATAEVTLGRPDHTEARFLLSVAPVVTQDGRIVGAVAYGEPLDHAAAGTLREAFIGVLSHELRTPITSIYGGSQLLLNDQLSADSRGEVLAAIAAEAEQLHRRVEDFLAIVRVERGVAMPEHEPVLLQRLVRRAIAAEHRRSPDRRIVAHVAADLPPAAGDEAQIAQVLRNLISNAVVATPAGGTVVVETNTAGRWIETRIKDRARRLEAADGDGFGLSSRGTSVLEAGGVSSLGMYVSRALVDANGGRIWRRPRRGGGNEVAFALPVYELAGEE
jgi:signal transduction histidine kinase